MQSSSPPPQDLRDVYAQPQPKDSSRSTAKKQDPLEAGKIAAKFIDAHTSDDVPTVRYWRGHFWRWDKDKPYYRRLSSDDMSPTVLKWLMDNGVSSSYRTAIDVTNCLKAMTFIEPETTMPAWLSDTAKPSDYLTMKNGLVRAATIAADWLGYKRDPYVPQRHTPLFFDRVYIPYEYNPEAKCEFFLEWLRDRLANEKEAERLIQEWMGYLLSRDNSMQTALFLVGPGGTGKTTLTKMMSSMLGIENCGHLSLSQFAGEHNLPSIQGKLLNISDEMDDLGRRVEATLKNFVGGSKVSLNEKYVPRYEDIPTARLVCNVNTWPKIHDTSGAIQRRLRVVVLDRKIDPDLMDPTMDARLRTQVSGVFNWAVAGLWRLRKQQRFTRSIRGEEEAKRVREENESHLVFLDQFVEEKKGGFAATDDVMAAYLQWCRQTGSNRTATEKTMSEAISEEYPTAKRERRRCQQGRKRGFSGIVMTY
jgi:P4 family phage/plasmid primase-like protien